MSPKPDSPWWVAVAITVTIVILGSILRGSELSDRFLLPWRLVYASWMVLGLAVPILGLRAVSDTNSPWRAIWYAWRPIPIAVMATTLLIWFLLLVSGHGQVLAQGRPPWMFAGGAIVSTLGLALLADELTVLLGSAARRLFASQMLATALTATLLILLESGLVFKFRPGFAWFYDITVGGTGLTQSWGIPPNGLHFPWPTFGLITGLVLGASVLIMTLLELASRRGLLPMSGH